MDWWTLIGTEVSTTCFERVILGLMTPSANDILAGRRTICWCTKCSLNFGKQLEYYQSKHLKDRPTRVAKKPPDFSARLLLYVVSQAPVLRNPTDNLFRNVWLRRWTSSLLCRKITYHETVFEDRLRWTRSTAITSSLEPPQWQEICLRNGAGVHRKQRPIQRQQHSYLSIRNIQTKARRTSGRIWLH